MTNNLHAIVLREGIDLGINEEIFGSIKSKIIETEWLTITTVRKVLTIYRSPIAYQSGACQNEPEPTNEECYVNAFECNE